MNHPIDRCCHMQQIIDTLREQLDEKNHECKLLQQLHNKNNNNNNINHVSSTTVSEQQHRSFERRDAATGLHPDSQLIRRLHEELQAKETALGICQEKLRFFCQSIARLQQECQAKDELVVELQNEIDKFRQVVPPLTQAFLRQRNSNDKNQEQLERFEQANWNSGVQSTRVLATTEPRMKRQGFSAEPLSELAGATNELIKIPKSTV